jgi:hypothetical protein
MNRNDVLQFHIEDNQIRCNHQLLFSYFIANVEWDRQYVQIKPLTIRFLLESTIKNYAIIIYWEFWRLLWRTGFIDIPEGVKYSWKYFRLAFWQRRANT